MKRLKILTVVLLSLIAISANGATITKGLIGEQDVHRWNGTAADYTFTRPTSTGGTITLNAFGWDVDVLASYGGGVSYTVATIDRMKTALGTTNYVSAVFRPGTWTITSNTTITPNFTTVVPPGTTFSISAGVTLTINGPLIAGPYTIFSGTGSVVYGGMSVKSVLPEWRGARADDSTDSGAFLNSTIVDANGRVPIDMAAGVYRSSVTISANVSGTHLRGSSDGYVYGPTSSPSSIKFTAALVDGVTQYVGAVAQAYITIENLTIDGNSLVTNGVNGGFFITLKNSNVINCTGPGMLITSGQAIELVDSAFNGNQDGIKTVTSFGSLYSERSSFRQNTRYGLYLTGLGGVARFYDSVVESNTDYGLFINGTFLDLKFDTVHFESNKGNVGHHMSVTNGPYQGQNEEIVFDNCYFATTNSSKAATIASGSVVFRDSTLYSVKTAEALTITAGSKVKIFNSFSGYPRSTNAIYADDVRVQKNSAINSASATTAGVTVSGSAINVAAGEFTVSFVLEILPTTGADITTQLLGGGAGGLYVTANTTIENVIQTFSFGILTGAATASIELSGYVGTGVPIHVVYSRVGTTGSLYLNGYLVESVTDNANYNANIATLMGTYGVSVPANTRLYHASIWTTAGLTAAQAYTLWKADGDPEVAGLTTNLVLNTRHDDRPYGSVYDTVTDAFFALNAGMSWVSPSSPVRGTTTLNAGAATTTVSDTGVTAASRIGLFPITANAAADLGSATSVWVSAKVAGTSFTITHPNNANADKTFEYVIYP